MWVLYQVYAYDTYESYVDDIHCVDLVPPHIANKINTSSLGIQIYLYIEM